MKEDEKKNKLDNKDHLFWYTLLNWRNNKTCETFNFLYVIYFYKSSKLIYEIN